MNRTRYNHTIFEQKDIKYYISKCLNLLKEMLEMQNKKINENFLFTRKIRMTQTIIEIDCFH